MAGFFTNNVIDLELANNQTGHATPGTGLLDSASIGLVNSNSVQLNRNTEMADLLPVEGGFPGYARQEVTWNGASIADDGTVEAVGVVPEFRPSGSSTVSIWGLFMTSDVSTTLVGCGPVDNPPTPMVDGTSALVITMRWRPQTGGVTVDVT